MAETMIQVAKAPMNERFPMTIPQELFDAWQLCWRKNDAKKLCKETGLSRPIIDRALKYGNVKTEFLVKRITKFFRDRHESENRAAEKMISQVLNSNY